MINNSKQFGNEVLGLDQLLKTFRRASLVAEPKFPGGTYVIWFGYKRSQVRAK